MRAAIYVRVSSARQVEEGFSLGEQESRCRSYVESRPSWTLDERHVHVEAGVSGGQASRPALDALMQAVEASEVDVVITPKIDRLGRNARHNLALFETFDSAGVVLGSPDGRTHEDKFIRTVESAIAERERDNISERVRRSVPGKRSRGSYNGGPRPLGYEFGDGGGLVVREDEAEIVRRIFREYNAGKGVKAVARALNIEGLKGPLGGRWTSGRVGDRLDLALYAGIVGGGEHGRHEPIIDPETFERARVLRAASAEREGKAKGGRRSNTHLLGNGLLVCECGASFYPRKDTRSNRDTYRCRGRDERTTDCTVPPLPRALVDAAVRAYIAGQVLSPGMAAGELEAEAKKAAKEATTVASTAEAAASKIEARLKNGRAAMLDDDPPFTSSEWRAFKAELEADLTAARAKAAEAKRVASALRAPSAALMSAVEAIRQAATVEAEDATTLGAQRAAVERIFARFEVITRPAPASTSGTASALIREQNAAVEAETADLPGFTFKARGIAEREVFIVPIPRPEVAERFGGDPMDSLHELGPGTVSQSVRNGLPCRRASGPR